MKLSYESLHNHTTASDGTQSYLEVLKTAEDNGFGVMAFSEHDSLPSEPDLKLLKAYNGPVKWLVGCEISSGLPVELGGGAASMFHILGLFTDPTSQPLLDHCHTAIAARAERMERIVSNLHSLGFTITVDDCLAESGGESVGRPHIVKALARYPQNAAIIRRLKDDMAAAAVQDATIAINYMNMIERHESDYPYRLFLSEGAFVPGIYVDYLYSIDMDRSVELIRSAGGVAILAHWPTISKKISLTLLEQLLKDGRLDGVELRSGFDDSAVARSERDLAQIVERTNAHATYGIDGHRAQDIEHFGRDTTLASKTIGQTQRLIERVHPDLSWSNF